MKNFMQNAKLNSINRFKNPEAGSVVVEWIALALAAVVLLSAIKSNLLTAASGAVAALFLKVIQAFA